MNRSATCTLGLTLAFCIAFLGQRIRLARADGGLAQEGRRFALVIAANSGLAGDSPLQFATSDATRVAETLTEVVGVLEEDIVIVRDATAARVRSKLSALNARIRSVGASSLLFVYYSGHADSSSLRMNGTTVPWQELKDLTASSAAATRVLVADACRSGEATNVKGVKVGGPLVWGNEDLPEGFAILSSAAAGEMAFESDEIGGSFFTHHLLAGLRGAADANADDQVNLDEAYRYASMRTIESTARTFSGIQHPTFWYDIRGRKELVVSRYTRASQASARLIMQRPGMYLIRHAALGGDIHFEIPIHNHERSIWLRPGTYRVQYRTPKALWQGQIELRANGSNTIAIESLQSVPLVHRVRKGEGDVDPVSGIWLGATLGTPWNSGRSDVEGATLAFERSWAHVTGQVQASWLTASMENEWLRARTQAFSLGATAFLPFDFGRWTFSPGLRVFWLAYRDVFETDRTAPDRSGLLPALSVPLRLDCNLWADYFLATEISLRLLDVDAATTRRPHVVAGLDGSIGVGMRW